MRPNAIKSTVTVLIANITLKETRASVANPATRVMQRAARPTIAMWSALCRHVYVTITRLEDVTRWGGVWYVSLGRDVRGCNVTACVTGCVTRYITCYVLRYT